MTLIQNVIHDLVLLSTLLVVVVLIVAGVKLLASRGNPSALTAAKEMMGKVIMGYIVILIAWVAVYSITSALIHEAFLPQFI